MYAAARAISWIENDNENKEELIDTLYPHVGKAMVIGITGPPGSGKSSLTAHLIERERKMGNKVAVIAVDPSSPFSGGAILGDRLRMQKHAVDEGVFIRSMASRGHLGGVAGSTGDALKVLDAAGFDTIIIETIGVGQTEIQIIEMTDLVLLVLVPGMGDEIQALKAGVMEIGDIFVINKSDKDDAPKLRAEVEYVLHLKHEASNAPINPIVMTSAKNNEGIDDLVSTIYNYFGDMKGSGQLAGKRKKRIAGEIRSIISGKVFEEVKELLDIKNRLENWVDEIYSKKQSPYSLINRKFKSFKREYIKE